MDLVLCGAENDDNILIEANECAYVQLVIRVPLTKMPSLYFISFLFVDHLINKAPLCTSRMADRISFPVNAFKFKVFPLKLGLKVPRDTWLTMLSKTLDEEDGDLMDFLCNACA